MKIDRESPPRQTPANFFANPELLSIIPLHARKVVEVGCSTGALAMAYKQRSPDSFYIGIDIEETYTMLAASHCDQTICGNIEILKNENPAFIHEADCWIFGDSLEHLIDPWSLLSYVRSIIASDGSVAACIPNSQHWSFFAKLAAGNLFLRGERFAGSHSFAIFTRRTIIDMFDRAGFQVTRILPRIFPHPASAKVLRHIGELANGLGLDARVAMNDALALQYVIYAEPKPGSVQNQL